MNYKVRLHANSAAKLNVFKDGFSGRVMFKCCITRGILHASKARSMKLKICESTKVSVVNYRRNVLDYS